MLSLVVPWRDRDEIEGAIASLCATAARRNGSLHIVNYGGDAPRLRALLGPHAAQTSIVDVEARFFNKARAHNIGASHAPHDLLFFCDCDIVLNNSVDTLFDRLTERFGVFGTVAGVRETERNARAAQNLVFFGYTLMLRIRNGRTLTIVDNEEDADDGTRQAPGLLVVKRADFEAVGGYNGSFTGWGWEDQDMIARLTLGLGLERLQAGIVEHISHDDAARTHFHPPTHANRWESRDRMFRQALANYDAANFQGTYALDARAPDGR